jgi:hypothetical protein
MANGFRNDDFTADNSITTVTLNVDEVQVDNIGITGNSIISTDLNGDINIIPNGIGNLVLDGLKWPQADGTLGFILRTNGAGQLSWVPTGSGNVIGPAISTDNAIARYDLATGTLIQNSGVIIDDSNNVTGVAAITATTANATTITTNVAAAQLSMNGITISGSGSDANVGITLTPKGAGDLTLDGLKWPQADGTAGYILKTDGAAQLSWAAAGSGDVVGPAASTDNAVVRFDLATGKVVQNSGVIIDDTNNVTGIDSITANTANATTITTNVAAAQLSLNGITLSSIGTNPNIGITLTPKAAGDLTLDGLKWPQADGSAGYILKTNGAAQLSWIAPPTGTGDVVGPAGATANAIPRYNSTTGKLIKDSSVLIDDSNNVTGVGSLTATTVVSNTLKTTSGTMDLDSFSTGIVYNKNNGQTYFQTRNNVDLTTGGQISTVSVTLTGTAWTIVGPFITGSALVIVTSAMNGALNMVAVIVENTIGGAGSVNYPVRIGGNLALQISAGNLELKKPIVGFDGIYTVYVFGGNQLYP